MAATAAAHGYTLDPAWHAERERLNSITSLYDPHTLGCCDRLGIGEGWRCLDVGAGTGSLAELLADRVGEDGRVLAVDVDVRFLEPLARPPLEVLRADVRSESLPGGFDLVHARLVLEHLPERSSVLRAMVGAARPGGWVLVEDFDWSTAGAVDPPSELHVDQLAPGMIAAGLLEESDVEDFHALWHDGDTVSFAPLMVSAWGRRP